MSRLPFVEGFCRGLATGLVVLAIVAGTARADALKWRRAAVVEAVEVTVTTVTRAELVASIRADGLKLRDIAWGHSRLYRNRETGAYRCAVLVAEGSAPAVLEHELRHCNGWVHQ